MNKNWNYYYFNFILANPDKPWNWRQLSRNPNITMEIVSANPDKPWNWYWLSRNPNTTMEIGGVFSDKPWDWNELSFIIYKYYF